ncbi:MAG: SMP-30/gluconolactonase/LRE family protein [Pseudomonadota bacterium]
MPAVEIECVVDIRAKTGEGAIWDVEEQALYWVDIPAGQLYRFDPVTNENRSWHFDEPIGCLALRQKGNAIVALKSGFYSFDFVTGESVKICDPEADKPNNRFNDGATDRQGRFWAGTMVMDQSARDGSFYRLDPNMNCKRWLGGIQVTNGLTFSPDGKTMYCSDSAKDVQTIWAMDYDVANGEPGERRVFFDCREVDGRPDGGTVDADGCYWMAGVSGWQLVRITPKGRVDRIVELPFERPSKPMFGGAGLDTLFVTSISGGLTSGSEARQPQAGGLFAVRNLGVQGVPEVRFQG